MHMLKNIFFCTKKIFRYFIQVLKHFIWTTSASALLELKKLCQSCEKKYWIVSVKSFWISPIMHGHIYKLKKHFFILFREKKTIYLNKNIIAIAI